jgi:mono/diheme cytochrome c family protein
MRAPALLLLVALAGCGGGGSDTSGKTPKDTFAGTCGSCHTLSDAGTKGTFGPNLDDLAPDKARVLNAIKTGPGGMPSGLLDAAQADAVAGYVSSVSGG